MRTRRALVAVVAGLAAVTAVPVDGSLGAWSASLSAAQDVTSDSVEAAFDVERAADGAPPGGYAAQPGNPAVALTRSASATAVTHGPRESRSTTGAVTNLAGAAEAGGTAATATESSLPPLLLPANREFASASGWTTTGTTSPATATWVSSGGRDDSPALSAALAGHATARSGTAVWNGAFDFYNATPSSLRLHYSARVTGASGLTGVNRWRVQLVQGTTVTTLDQVAIAPTAPGSPPLHRWLRLSPTLLQPDQAYSLRLVTNLSLAAGASGVTVLFDDVTIDARATTALLPKNRKFLSEAGTSDWTVDWTNKSATGVNVNQWASSEGSPNDSEADGVGALRASFSHGVTAAEQVVVWQTRVTLAGGVAATFRYDQRYLLGDQLDRVNSRWDWYLLPPSASTAPTATTSPLLVDGGPPPALDPYRLDGSAIDPPPFPGTDPACPTGTNYWRHYPGSGGAAPFCSRPAMTSLALGADRVPDTGTYTLAVRVRILALSYGLGDTGTANGASLAFDNVVLQLVTGEEQLDSVFFVPAHAHRSAVLTLAASTTAESFRVSLLRSGSWVPVLMVSAGTTTQTVDLTVRTDVSSGDVLVRFQDTGGGDDVTPDTLSVDLLTVTGTDPPPVPDHVTLAFGPVATAADTGRLARAFVLRNTSSRAYTVRVAASTPLLAYAGIDTSQATSVSDCTVVVTDVVALASQCRVEAGGTLPVDVRVVTNGVAGPHVLPVVVTLQRVGAAVDQSAFYRLTALGTLSVT